MVALTLVLVGVLAYWASEREAGQRFGPPPGSSAPQATTGSVGTSGVAAPPRIAENDEAVVAQPAVIQELDTITGSVDGQQLIGRRIDLHVVVQSVPNDVVFWIGPPDNRVLVALARDTRSEAERQRGVTPRHHILPVHAGQSAAISGSIQRIPRADEMSNWRLTENDVAEAVDRKLYIRADTVTTNGHGTH
jgi:hypothetical protein